MPPVHSETEFKEVGFKEASFPSDYREAEVRQIMLALYRRRSITITGLAGMGKSNLVRFLVSHPEVRARYLGERADDTTFIHIDCAGLARTTEDELLGEVATRLWTQGLATGVTDLPESLRTPRRSLTEQILRIDPDLYLVLVLDYFDEAAAALDGAFYNYLFYLRNARPHGSISYVFVTRRPTGHFHELHELFDDGCRVGPLNPKDARDALRRDEDRLTCAFTPAVRDLLVACTGGHPGFLKNAGELVCSGSVATDLPATAVAEQLLQAGKIRNLCQELWDDLAPEEQAILHKVAAGPPLRAALGPGDRARVKDLEQTGLLVGSSQGHAGEDLAIFCPLFEAYIGVVASAGLGGTRIEALFPNRARIAGATGEHVVTLSPRLFALLSALAAAQGRVLTADTLIDSVFAGEAEGVTNAALSQLVKRLRAALNPDLRRMTNDPTADCVETIRDVGYRLTT